MAVRKFLFINAAEGYHEEQLATDELNLGKITLSGVAGIAIDAGGTRISNLPSAFPTTGTDAASKAYVDSVAQGLRVKEAVRALADTSQTLSGVPGAAIDGVTMVADDRILLTNQSTASQDGIWVIKAGAWVRPVDFPTGGAAASAFTFVQEGTNYADTGWVCTTDSGSDVIDTNSLAWSQFSGAGSITPGAGLVLNGSAFDVGNGPGIKVNADSIEVELATTPGLEFDVGGVNGKLRWDPDTARGLAVDATGAYIALAATPGLQFSGGLLDAYLNGTGGLEKDASGIAVKIDDTPDTLDSDANGLKVVGLPSLFKIAGTAVGSTVNAANLDDLTDGTVITTLHSHAASQTLAAELEANETVAAGDPVVWSGDADEFNKGDAGNDSDARVFGVAEDAITATNTGTVIRRGVAAGVLSGATPGTPYYLAAGGGYTTTPPGAGNRVIRIGYAINATDLEVLIHDFGKKAA